jgi:hypothetical protein
MVTVHSTLAAPDVYPVLFVGSASADRLFRSEPPLTTTRAHSPRPDRFRVMPHHAPQVIPNAPKCPAMPNQFPAFRQKHPLSQSSINALPQNAPKCPIFSARRAHFASSRSLLFTFHPPLHRFTASPLHPPQPPPCSILKLFLTLEIQAFTIDSNGEKTDAFSANYSYCLITFGAAS